uniref:DoxX family protein n=1 Tax=Blastomonas sp. TaxID=1909299 RepID=UPI003593C2C8
YLVAGVAHIRSPGGFLAITPYWVPWPETVIFWTGVAEIAGAIGLMVPRLRYAAGIGLALYALCVFPANINHALGDIAIGGRQLPWTYHGPRLLFQPVAIWWALWVGGVIDWPFRRNRGGAAQ